MGGQAGEDGDFASSCFVEHADACAVAEGAAPFGDDEVGVLDETPRADVVVGDVVLDVFDEGVVSHGDVVQGGVPDAGADGYASGEGECMAECAEADVAGETDVRDAVRGESGHYGYIMPVVRRAALCREAVDFVLSQVSCFHVVLCFIENGGFPSAG